MKKKLNCVIAVALICILAVLATGCKGRMADSKYLGTWTTTKASICGFDVVLESTNNSFTVDLKADGTYDFNGKINGKTDESSGNWAETENGIYLKEALNGLFFIEKGETLELEVEGVILTLERKGENS